MSLLIIFAVLVLTATAVLIIASFVTASGRAPDAEQAPAPPDGDRPDGPDRRAGGPGFRRAALQAAQDTPAAPAQRRRTSRRRRRALEAAKAAHVADLATGADDGS